MSRAESHPREVASVHVLRHARGEAMDDEGLLSRLRAGGAAAGALLYDRYWRDVNKMVWRLVPGYPDRDDLVNDVFVRLIAAAPRLKDASNLRGWVLRVTVNTVRTELRRARRVRHVGGEVDPERIAGVVSDPHTRRLMMRTLGVLQAMAARERLAFTLRHLDGRTLEDVADLCDCSLATAKRRVRRSEQHFVAKARRDPELSELLRRSRWDVS